MGPGVLPGPRRHGQGARRNPHAADGISLVEVRLEDILLPGHDGQGPDAQRHVVLQT